MEDKKHEMVAATQDTKSEFISDFISIPSENAWLILESKYSLDMCEKTLPLLIAELDEKQQIIIIRNGKIKIKVINIKNTPQK